MNTLKILLVVNAEWYFWSHRLPLAKALQAQGADVVVAATIERGYDTAIRQAGFRFVPLRLQRRSTNPFAEIACVSNLLNLYRQEKPDIIHHFTIKPVLYGSLAARLVGISRVINTIPGRGYTFLGDTWSRRLMRLWVTEAYRLALSGKRTQVIFQNPEDYTYFVRRRLVSEQRAHIIRGSGVDIEVFEPAPEPEGTPIVLLAARLLWDKGVAEFVEAAQLVRATGIPCRFVLVGAPDVQNPSQVPESTLKLWHETGIIEWWGLRDDMPSVLRQSTIVTLPSYSEGVPKILLEAAATARTIITTDTPGCREIVEHNVTGLLVPPRQSASLADAIHFALLNPSLRQQWGYAARQRVEREFEETIITSQTLDVYRKLLES